MYEVYEINGNFAIEYRIDKNTLRARAWIEDNNIILKYFVTVENYKVSKIDTIKAKIEEFFENSVKSGKITGIFEFEEFLEENYGR